MDLPASFSSLPPELVSSICSVPSLSKEDLISLRLTSKTQGIHASATKTFAKRYFTDIPLLNNKYSLETFVKISQHPVFGPTIRRVQLSCARYNDESFYHTVDDLRNENYHHDYFSKQVQRLSQRCDDAYFKVVEAQTLLDQAFVHLAEWDQCFVLTVSTNEDQSLGCSKTWVSDMQSEGWWADPQLVLDHLLEAANKSGCKVEKVEIFIDTVSECELYDSDSVTDSWKEWKSVRSLSALAFDLEMPQHVSEGCTDLGIMQSLLSLAIDLKVLHIRADIWPRDEDKMGTLMESISYLPLEELHLTDLTMRQDIMTDLLEELGPTLRRLKLSECNIVGSWKQILLSIQQHTLQLDDLHISGTKRSWLKETVKYKGVFNVRLGVARLLEEREDMLQDVESESQLESDSDGD